MPKITPLTVRGIVDSNPECFRSLYDEYHSYLCGIAMYYVRDSEVVKELVNDVFLRVWQHRSSLKYPPLPYLVSGIRNACLNYLRTAGKASEVRLVLMDNPPDVTLPFSEDEVGQIVRTINDVAASLPEKCFQIFSLHYNEGVESAEIAERLGISRSTVRVQLKIALDRIREKINGPS